MKVDQRARERGWPLRACAALRVTNQTLVLPHVSAGTCQGGAIDCDSAALPLMGQDFEAILFGDTTGNWVP